MALMVPDVVTAPVKVDAPSTVSVPFAWILPALLMLTPVEPYPPPIATESKVAAAFGAVNELALGKLMVALLIVAVPVFAPMVTAVAAPPILSVVTVVLNRLPVVWLVSIVPELALMLPPALMVPSVAILPLLPVREK